jgi:hypothetical protein
MREGFREVVDEDRADVRADLPETFSYKLTSKHFKRFLVTCANFGYTCHI